MTDISGPIGTAVLGALIGAMLGFFGSYGIWWLERLRQRRAVRMQIAINLRRWMNRTLYQMYDIQTWVDSEGRGGNIPAKIQNFRFERALEQVALLEHRMTVKIFKIIHGKDFANAEIEAEREYGDDDAALDLLRGRIAKLWLRAFRLYDQISSQIGWADRGFTENEKTTMQSELDRFQKIKSKESKLATELFQD